MTIDIEAIRKRAEKATPRPWELRGFGLYVPFTNRRIVEIPVAWKTSEEAKATAELVFAAIHQQDAFLTTLNERDATIRELRMAQKIAVSWMARISDEVLDGKNRRERYNADADLIDAALAKGE